ncbi:MAG TPA: flagellar assembly protein FliW [Ruminococcaceae bacterium]|nr:flagellar assembly protein FliW [Oscillospiraceae bacterium]
MSIETRDFGTIEVDEKDVYDFPNGLYAFEDSKKFALLSPLGDDVYPMWLQSMDDPGLCFIVFNPVLIDGGFTVMLADNERSQLGLDKDGDATALVIAKVPADYKHTTVNMKSPIVINKQQHKAIQVILPLDYPFRMPIYAPREVK